jgi:UDP-N-acetylmuramoyl-tripeptide--D-alanyl-D-alanine ligase
MQLATYGGGLANDADGNKRTMQWTVAKLIEATRGAHLQGRTDASVRGICTDTRTLLPGDCFLALSGENHDGHDFVPAALAKHAGAIIIERERPDFELLSRPAVSVIQVEDTLYALGELARYVRGQFPIPVVGITGSNGKTSTKEMLAGILARNKQVLKNKGNFNNLIGVPLTLLSLQPHHQAAVVEMGINVPGEMFRLAEICSPTVGLVTNVHPAHLEGLESLDRILEEKTGLWSALRHKDLAVVNLDDERLARFSETLRCRTVTYSLKDPAAQVKLVGDVETTEESSVFRAKLGDHEISLRFPVLGLHQVQNALAAAAAAWGMGESPETIAEALAMHQPVRQRMQLHRLPDGRVLMDDSYNANPESMLAAVRTVLSTSRGKPVLAVLGEMKELGPESDVLHYEVGREVGVLSPSQLVTFGEKAREIARGAMQSGMLASECFHAETHEEAVAWIREHGAENGWILVKGSRGMRMEHIVEGILTK